MTYSDPMPGAGLSVRPDAPDIAVAGLIGAGKSTLVSALAPLVGATSAPERFDENPYFERFYREPTRWAFPHFVFFLEQSLSDRVHVLRSGRGILQERNVLEHLLVFGREFEARGYLDHRDLAVLERLVRTCVNLSGRPRLLVYIQITPEEALRRLRNRARDEEGAIDLEYLQSLAARYSDLLGEWGPEETLVVPAEEYDFRRTSDVQAIAARISGQLRNNDQETSSAGRAARHG